MVLPVLSIMLVAIIFGGITFFNYVQLADAVAAGARELGEDGGNQGTAQLACEMANTALLTAAGNLNASQIASGETFVSTNDSCSVTTAPLIQGDTGTVTATYPCNLPIPFTNMNLCPMHGGTTLNGVTCPTTYCISATTTVIIQ